MTDKVTKFQSPVPIVLKIRDLIYGKEKPDFFTRMNFLLNLVLWATFMIWSLISFYAVNARHFIYQQKGIPVEAIIKSRGRELGFDGDDFLQRLLTANGISVICWAAVFIALIFMYRRSKRFFYPFIVPILFYIGMLFFYISPAYFFEDTTTFDKIALLIMLTSASIYYYLIKNKGKDEEINFFGVEADEDDT
jgi:hypothetical protein